MIISIIRGTIQVKERTNHFSDGKPKGECLVVFGVTLLSRLELTIPPCGGRDPRLIHRHQAENPLAAAGGFDVVGDRQISRSLFGSVSEPSHSLP